jgi:hypothetical protein
MSDCRFVTILTRECGRPATHVITWTATSAGRECSNELAVCPFHREIQLVDLALDCEVLSWAEAPLQQEVA